MLWTMVMAMNPEKKERTIKGDQCDLAEKPLMIKSVFYLRYKHKK